MSCVDTVLDSADVGVGVCELSGLCAMLLVAGYCVGVQSYISQCVTVMCHY